MAGERAGELVGRIRQIGPAVMPPFSSLAAGAPQDAADYLAFYGGLGREAVDAPAAYRQAVEQFGRSAATDAAALLAARERLIRALPFCQDDLAGLPDRQNYEPLVLMAYRHPDAQFWSAWAYLEYEQLVAELLELLAAAH